jgi:phage/plasmid primase-like uncharacterized protein
VIDEKRRRYQSAKADGGKRREIPEGTTIAAKGAKLKLPETQAAKRTSLIAEGLASAPSLRNRSAYGTATGRQSPHRLCEPSIM